MCNAYDVRLVIYKTKNMFLFIRLDICLYCLYYVYMIFEISKHISMKLVALNKIITRGIKNLYT